MSILVCGASCTVPNHASTRFCVQCGLPLGTLQADAGAGVDALGPYEAPEPADLDVGALASRVGEAGGV